MQFRHRDGDRAPRAKSLGPVRDTVSVDADGVFEVDEDRDDYDDLVEALAAAGHEPLDDPDASEDVAEEQDETLPQAGDFAESEIVEMDYKTKQSIAAQYDGIKGNASGDRLTEALIERRREEADG